LGSLETREFDFGAYEKADSRQEANFALAVNVRLATLKIDDADQFAAAENGNGEEGFVAILGEVAKGAKARVLVSIAADGHGNFVFGDPAGDAVANLEFKAIDDGGVGIFGGAEHELGAFENVDKAGIEFGDDGDEVDDFAENFMEWIGSGETAADFVKELDVAGVAFNQSVEITHGIKLARGARGIQCKNLVRRIGKAGGQSTVDGYKLGLT
jgi:hypothetical protein